MHALLADAVSYPLTLVIAGAGSGKTHAVYEFARGADIPVSWMQLSERDNASSRFWEKYTQVLAGWDAAFAQLCRERGFPDTEDKLNRYMALRLRNVPNHRRLFVLDDAHLIDHPDILRFLERRLLQAAKNISVILICRRLPAINLASLQVRGLIPLISEDDLNFTEDELARYLAQQGLSVSRQSLHDILEDTKGWAFSVGFAARSLKKSPGYAGYVRVAMRKNLFQLMETEAFGVVSEKLRRFLVRLSLIDHLSTDLIASLARGDEGLLGELRDQHAYIRLDGYVNTYMIHHLFLDFLRTKQAMLTPEEAAETYKTAADWCRQNGYTIDALLYQEKTGDCGGIAAILHGLPVQMPTDIALCAAGIFARAPECCFDEVELFAVMHVRVFIRLGRWEEAVGLMRSYEERFSRLGENDPFRNRTLGVMYFDWGNVRALMSTLDESYDFDAYFAKMDECLSKTPVESGHYAEMPIGFWAGLAGAARRGAPQAYIEALARSVRRIAHCWGASWTGLDVLCRGELLFYQGERSAESVFTAVLRQARENRQFEIEGKALFYLMRLALLRGNRKEAERILREMEARLDEPGYDHRFFNYDAALGWYFCALGQPKQIPAWLQENFAPYSHAYFVENIGNQIKARYHYQIRDYQPLLGYIEEMKQRESIIYGRLEMLALEACTHYLMKNKAAALRALREAYEQAAPNDIVTPFVECGKDMRTLAAAALNDPECGIPSHWLEKVKRRSASFAKQRSAMISGYKKSLGSDRVRLSMRESAILSDLYHGLSRPEIAEKQLLAINTVNSAINNIFNKLGAHSVADAVRIAAEEKLVDGY